MNDLRLALRQVYYENKIFWRNPPAVFFTVALPMMFLVIFNLLFGDDQIDRGFAGGDVSGSTFYVPGIAALSVISAAYTNIAMMVSIARDNGLLKRTRGTPLPPWAFLFGKIVHATFVALLLVFLVVAFGAIFYDVDVPTNTMPAFIVTLVIGSASFCALGLAMTGLISNADAAPAVVNGSILPLFFISDIFIPLQDAPAWLEFVGGIFPVKHFSEAMGTAFNPYETGAGFEWTGLGIIALWGLIGVIVATRYFTWEPRK